MQNYVKLVGPVIIVCRRISNVVPITLRSMRKSGVSFETMFEEVPIVIKNSHLLNSLLCDLEDTTTSKNKFNFLDLATG